MVPPETPGPDYIEHMRSRYVDSGVRLFALLSVYVALISMTRSLHTGWLPIYNLQIGLAAVLLGLFFFSRALSDRVKALIMVTIAFTAGVSGVLTFGLLGSGFFYIILAALFLAIFFSRRYAYAAILGGALVLIVVGYLHMEGVLDFSIDPATYMQNQASWWTVAFGPFIVAAFLVYIIGDARSKLIDTLVDLDASHRQIAQQALHDTLTELPNLRHLQQRFDALLRKPDYRTQALAVLILDLDGFKKVNDRYGHMEGDYVLQDIAHRLKYCVAEQGFVARLGGDEFVILLHAPTGDEQGMETFAGRVFAAIRHPTHMVNDDRVSISVSVGAVLLCPAHGHTLNEALHEADLQMYQAKREGGNRLRCGRLERHQD